jgi:hypothetical protein
VRNRGKRVFFSEHAIACILLSRIKQFCYRQGELTVIRRLPKSYPTPLRHSHEVVIT